IRVFHVTGVQTCALPISADPLPRLALPASLPHGEIAAVVDAMAFGRDLINTPSNDMGPEELEAAARKLAELHGADFRSIVGENLDRKSVVWERGRATVDN